MDLKILQVEGDYRSLDKESRIIILREYIAFAAAFDKLDENLSSNYEDRMIKGNENFSHMFLEIFHVTRGRSDIDMADIMTNEALDILIDDYIYPQRGLI